MANSCTQPVSQDPGKWNDEKLSEWYNSGEWKHGWTVIPDESINQRELAIQYFKNPARWEKAFTFLKINDLENMNTGRYELDGNNLFANISEYTTHEEEKIMYEAHRIYADIQYLVSGEEKIGVVPLGNTKEVVPYDSTKEASFATAEKDNYRIASPEKFFIFFPDDAHRPGVNPGDDSVRVTKVVVKVRIEE